MERRLAAIFAADVVGYSRLMGEDEEATLDALKSHRDQLIGPKIAEHTGRVVDFVGDATLAEFSSVVDAVKCALDIQEGLRRSNTGVPEDRQFVLRIGINLGDIIVEKDSIYGDGVNVAARLEALAEPGGICLSRAARDQVRDKLDLSLEDLGEIEVKNISRPVHAFNICQERAAKKPSNLGAQSFTRPVLIVACCLLFGLLAGVAWWQFRTMDVIPMRSEQLVYPVPDKPSIAVLAFDNLGEMIDTVSLGDALSENLITELSRDSELFVIARNSSFSYKGKPIRVRQVAEELGVRYLIDGSVQKSGTKARVTVQLIDALAGNHLWAERYDRNLDDIFKIQDEIAETVVSQILTTVERSERKRVSLMNPSNLQAFEYRMLAVSEFLKWTREGTYESRRLLYKAIEADPGYARAYAGLVWIYLRGYSSGWSDLARDAALAKAKEFGQKALKLDPHDSFNYRAMAHVYIQSRDLERSLSQLETALKLNPNDAKAYVEMSDPLVYLGRNQEAIEAVEKAMRLDPHHPDWYLWQLGWAQYHAEQYQAALTTLEKMSNPPNKARRVWAAIFLRLGRRKEAEAMIAEFLKREPDFNLAAEFRQSKHRNSANRKRFVDDMRQLFSNLPSPERAGN